MLAPFRYTYQFISSLVLRRDLNTLCQLDATEEIPSTPETLHLSTSSWRVSYDVDVGRLTRPHSDYRII